LLVVEGFEADHEGLSDFEAAEELDFGGGMGVEDGLVVGEELGAFELVRAAVFLGASEGGLPVWSGRAMAVMFMRLTRMP
jgi:hypothetical protein